MDKTDVSDAGRHRRTFIYRQAFAIDDRTVDYYELIMSVTKIDDKLDLDNGEEVPFK